MHFPNGFIESISSAPGFDESSFAKAHEHAAPVAIRVNPAKLTKENLPWPHTNVPWSSNGIYLEERPAFILDPFWHAGAYYVQEASSMFLEEVLRQCMPSTPVRALDLCAAPGGKSTLIQSMLPAGSLLVSNEVIKTRANILVENMTKWGAANVVVTNNDPAHFKKLPHFFDLIVVDAPCSGSGLFRKDAAAMQEWSPGNVALCSQRQQRILADVLPALAPGGTLIYSTCSYSVEEDEQIADWLAGEQGLQSVQIKVNASWNIVETQFAGHSAFGYRFYPGKLAGEGFFIAAFTRRGPQRVATRNVEPKIKSALSTAEQSIAANYLDEPAGFSFHRWQDNVLAIPKPIFADFSTLQKDLYIRKAGVNMGQLLRNELLPSHDLVVSTIGANILPAVELSLQQAQDYLRKTDFHLAVAQRGWAVVKYHGVNLGLVKILPSRINNYYPKEWRILNK